MDLGQRVFKNEFKGKVISVNEFRNSFDGGAITSNAVLYAMSKDLIDYIKIDDKINLIVLTDKTKAYTPNKSPKRG